VLLDVVLVTVPVPVTVPVVVPVVMLVPPMRTAVVTVVLRVPRLVAVPGLLVVRQRDRRGRQSRRCRCRHLAGWPLGRLPGRLLGGRGRPAGR
jgi:hypothetical protein